jgi:beta-glucosidase
MRILPVVSCAAGAVVAHSESLPDIDNTAAEWRDQSLSPDNRASALLKLLTFEEKSKFLSRYVSHRTKTSDWTGGTLGVERLGVPSVWYEDGPQGFRDELHHNSTTAWPCALAWGQTWDRGLAKQWGTAMGGEFRDKGAGVQLGPAMNVQRIPQNGRNFEYISGEDPVLGAEMVSKVIQGIQSNLNYSKT